LLARAFGGAIAGVHGPCLCVAIILPQAVGVAIRRGGRWWVDLHIADAFHVPNFARIARFLGFRTAAASGPAATRCVGINPVPADAIPLNRQ